MSVPANFFDTYDIVASPTGTGETVIAILGGVGELLPGLSVHLRGWVNLSPDGSATSPSLAVRRGSLTGDVVSPGIEVDFTPAATFGTMNLDLEVVDVPGNFAGAIYVLTLELPNAGGPSTVNAVHLGARTC